jgi:hypothetical protein
VALVCSFIFKYKYIPVVPCKAVAEVSKIGKLQVVGVVLLGVLAALTSTTTAGCTEA